MAFCREHGHSDSLKPSGPALPCGAGGFPEIPNAGEIMLATAQMALRILLVDDEINIRKTLSVYFESKGHDVIAVCDGRDAIAEAASNHFDVAFVDLRLKNASGSDLIPELIAQNPWIKVVVMTAHATVDSAVETLKRGAVDYITKPFGSSQMRQMADFLGRQMAAKQVSPVGDERRTGVILESANAAMQRTISLAHQVVNTEVTVLLRGESGTGKGVLARTIHDCSQRAAKSFATISCPALSTELLASELFGHVKGAFTGAVRNNPGRIATCDGGTLFLDEIGDLPLDLQPKLLRFVQDREYESVGDSVTKQADVRLIAATNVNLEDAVRAGRFREDLLYRINVIQIDVPALRHRAEDIIPLAEHLIAELRGDKAITGFTDEAVSALNTYNWPGNVRELRNVIERAVILCTATRIGLEHLPGNFLPHTKPRLEVGDPVPLDKLEELHIRKVLARTKSLDEAARILKMDPATLWRRRKKYGI
jgi:NtrC-family two-component system response regulator AlgB